MASQLQCARPASRLQALLQELPKLKVDLATRPDTILKEFTLFGSLPLELRSAIWRIAAHEPREINLTNQPYNVGVGSNVFIGADVPGQRSIPAILHATVESRSEGLRYYTLCEENTDDFFADLVEVTYLYANFEADHFVLIEYDESAETTGHYFSNFEFSTLKKIKFLELSLNTEYESTPRSLKYYPSVSQLMPFLELMPELAELVIIHSGAFYVDQRDAPDWDQGFIWRALTMERGVDCVMRDFVAHIQLHPKSTSSVKEAKILFRGAQEGSFDPIWDEDLYPIAADGGKFTWDIKPWSWAA